MAAGGDGDGDAGAEITMAMATPTVARAFHLTAGLRLGIAVFLGAWLLLAAFPLLWILVMSFKLPVDAFAPNPLTVLFGPHTKTAAGGLSPIAALLTAAGIYLAVRLRPRARAWRGQVARMLTMPRAPAAALAWLTVFIAAPAALAAAVWVAVQVAEALLSLIPALDWLARPFIGFTLQHYHAVWVGDEFYRQFINSAVITFGVVLVSLTIGTTAGYALARARSSIAFWLLITALVFRALPHSVLVSGYLPPFIEYGFYGKHIAVVVVLAAINQPFTIWMLRSFFANIPAELDEAALVDGCSPFQAFWRVIMPVMWPGVITTGLFSFLLAYNDYLVTALLLDGPSMTMVPTITQYFNRETTMTDQVEAVAAAVSITAPLFLLVMIFQKQIVSGLVQGAVKG